MRREFGRQISQRIVLFIKPNLVALGTEDAAVVFESYYFCRIGDYVCCERSVFVQTASDRSDRLDLLLHVFMP